MFIVDNAVILAAGTASRFAPLSYENPKALISVKGEILLERQIRQLQDAGIPEIYIVVGYQAEKFAYLEQKFGVHLVYNQDYLKRNNNSSIYVVRDILRNTYICSSDNFFAENPFEREVSDCYYAAVYADGPTKEWCMKCFDDGTVYDVQIGGNNAWYMLGHAFWDENFSKRYVEILEQEYDFPETTDLLWESIYIKHLNELKMKIRKYASDMIFEFDTLDELREFDATYVDDTRSDILKNVARQLKCQEKDLVDITSYKDDTNEAAGFTFLYNNIQYVYVYKEKELKKRENSDVKGDYSGRCSTN